MDFRTSCGLLAIACSSLFASSAAIAAPAGNGPFSLEDKAPGPDEDAKEAPAPQQKVLFSTGVAKGRDLLDSAISTSAMSEEQVQQLGARSLGELLRTVPGFRVEANGDNSGANFTIRGLPLTGFGSKFVQFQEDGLPVLELGDFSFMTLPMVVKPDLTLSRIESIRGGSASTFASNSPGGVLNFISRTGEEEGGSVMLSTGLGYSEHRVDFDYGGRLSKSLRFNIGGYYHQGGGARDPGFTTLKGGQLRVNVTREFDNGYVRLYAKLLNDRTPVYIDAPIGVSGTNANPTYANVANFDVRKNFLQSPYTRSFVALNADGNLERDDMGLGAQAISKSLGLEAKFEAADWTFIERMRYTNNSGQYLVNFPALVLPAPAMAYIFGDPGATLSYGSGPDQGKTIANPATLNGNGLLAYDVRINNQLKDFDNFINDLRATRVWKLGAGDFTLTAGVYKSIQNAVWDSMLNTAFQDVNGASSAMIDIRSADNTLQTANGILGYTVYPLNGRLARYYDIEYDTTAPYASANYHIGKLAIGGSIRYDRGKVSGQLIGAELGGAPLISYDINHDGVISLPETRVSYYPTSSLAINYSYEYVSYSAGVNYRFSTGFAAFARYSRGGRATGDSIFFTPMINTSTGGLVNSKDAYGIVRQAEAGVKYREGALALNLTGFYATTNESNFQIITGADGVAYPVLVARNYRAYGAEFEGSYFQGPFGVTASATYTHAEITSDKTRPEFAGNTPRHQPKLIAQIAPTFTTRLFSAGTSVIYNGSSYAQDVNELKMPAYTTVNAFVQIRPLDRIEFTVNASNLFNTLGITNISQGAIPSSGVVTGTFINGRTVSASMRVRF